MVARARSKRARLLPPRLAICPAPWPLGCGACGDGDALTLPSPSSSYETIGYGNGRQANPQQHDTQSCCTETARWSVDLSA